MSTLSLIYTVTLQGTYLLVYNNICTYREVRFKMMKIVTLCQEGSCCPVVKITEQAVEIGEDNNLCILKLEEWETLKSKILNKEL
jgi:hypothetical protein